MPEWQPASDQEIEAQFAEARTAARQTLERGLVATAARYDRPSDRIVIELGNGLTLMFPPAIAQGLSDASADDLEDIQLGPAGWAIDWPRLDAGFTVEGLLAGILGDSNWMARHFGRRGGQVRSAAKTAAVRENGKKGGRPRKSASRG